MLFKGFRQARAQALRASQSEERLREAQEAWAKLLTRVSKLETALRDLEEQHSTTVSHLNKLRGQVHGPRAQLRSVPNSADEIPFGDKEALRQRAGLVHGQRFIHKDEKE